MPKLKLVLDRVNLPFKTTTVNQLLDKQKELKQKGWKKLVILKGQDDIDRSRFYCGRPHVIEGERLETEKECKARIRAKEKLKIAKEKEKEKKKLKEINLMKRIAKKYHYTLKEGI